MCCLRARVHTPITCTVTCASHSCQPSSGNRRAPSSGEHVVRASAWIRNRRRMHSPPTSWSRISGLTIHHSPSSPRSNPDWDLCAQGAPILNLAAGFLQGGEPGAAWEGSTSKLHQSIRGSDLHTRLQANLVQFINMQRKAKGAWSVARWYRLSVITKLEYHRLDRRKC